MERVNICNWCLCIPVHINTDLLCLPVCGGDRDTDSDTDPDLGLPHFTPTHPACPCLPDTQSLT